MPDQTNDQPLIVGAGPVGKSAALFLAREGISVRIIDEAEEPSPYSKALAINPRTLEILEPTGITEKMLSLGLPIHGVRFSRPDKTLLELRFSRLKHRYPFMLALSQATTERLLMEALAAKGICVERGIKLVGCRDMPDGAEVELLRTFDSRRETLAYPWLLAADGAHSTVRDETRMDFPGSTFARPWELVDIPLATEMEHDWAHVFFLKEGFAFCIRVVDDTSRDVRSHAIWRVMSNLPDFIERIPGARTVGEPVWQSKFHISHRIVRRFQAGHLFFAGDAAHLHSPVGARGLNLGLKDAWVLSRLAKIDRLDRYMALRHDVDRRVVRRVELLSRMARGESTAARYFRSLLPWLASLPPISRRILAMVTGLDHPLPFR